MANTEEPAAMQERDDLARFTYGLLARIIL